MEHEFEAGDVKPLWSVGHYDGPMTLVGELADGRLVYLDASRCPGGWCQKPRWLELERLLDELLDDEDAENIWDRIERKHEDEMWETRERTFDVYLLTPEFAEELRDDHRLFQLHVGLHCDFEFDENGRGVRDRRYWGNSNDYHVAHFYKAKTRCDVDPEKKLDHLGTLTRGRLYEGAPHFRSELEDPRGEELVRYQRTWRPGDPVRTEW